MATYVHAEALNMSICKLSSENAADLSVIEALEAAFADELDASPCTPRSENGFCTKERTASKESVSTRSTMASETAEDVLEQLQLAEAEALEFERQESGADEDRIHDLRNDVDVAQIYVETMQERRSEDNLPSPKRIRTNWFVADSLQTKHPATEIVHESSPVTQALEEALAEGVEAFQRQASGEEEDHLAALQESLKVHRASDQFTKEALTPRTPEYIFCEQGKCDVVTALEQAQMEMLESQAQDCSDEEDWEATISNVRASIALLSSCK